VQKKKNNLRELERIRVQTTYLPHYFSKTSMLSVDEVQTLDQDRDRVLPEAL